MLANARHGFKSHQILTATYERDSSFIASLHMNKLRYRAVR